MSYAPNISLGSAYHYYPSKVAIVLDYYHRGQDLHEAAADAALKAGGNDVAQRLTNLVRAKVDLVRGDRHLLGHIAGAAVTPGDSLSAFAPETRDIRERAIALFDRALGELDVGPHRRVVTVALWVVYLGLMLYLVHDQSEKQAATDTLIGRVAQQMTPLLMLANTPMAEPLIAGVTKTLSDAGLIPEGEDGLHGLESDESVTSNSTR